MIILKRNILFVFCFLAMAFTQAGCSKNDDTTITLVGTEYYIDDILTVIPESLQNEFKTEMNGLPEGAVPPKIEGNYVVAPKQRVTSNVSDWVLQVVEPNTYLRFSNQHNGIATMELSEATETKTDTVFVRGNGNEFTVYFIENKEYEIEFDHQDYHVKMKRGIVMRGEVTNSGLANYYMATVIMESEDDSNGVLNQYPVGSYFIYRDGDLLASKTE